LGASGVRSAGEDSMERRNRRLRVLLLVVMAILGGGTIFYVAMFGGQ